MDDDVIQRIDELVAEEHRLRSRASEGHRLSEDDEQRLEQLEARLDQCWDLLRQRRARRRAGQDAGDAQLRPTEVVERYQQ
jgi:Rad3-related DNA helicase